MSTHRITASPNALPTHGPEQTESGAAPAPDNAPVLTQRAQTPSPFDAPSHSSITLTTATAHPTTTTTTTVIAGHANNTNAATAPTFYLSDLALEIKHEIFRLALRDGVFNSGVLSYAKSAKMPRTEVIDFLATKSADEEFGPRMRASTLSGMVECSKRMVSNAPELRQSFESSARYTARHANVPGLCRTTFDEFAGVEFRFAEINSGSDLLPDLRALEGKPIKLNANSIGRYRFLREVLPALAHIPKACPVVLIAANNQLTADDLAALVEQMQTNPCVVQLNLNHNPLCESDRPCLPLADLFRLTGPTTHLYLADTRFNDATAACIQKALAKNPCLECIDLRLNNLTENGAILIAEAIATKGQNDEIHVNPVLRSVRMQHNQYGDKNHKVAMAVQIIEAAKRIYLDKENALTGISDSDGLSDLEEFSMLGSDIPMVAEIDGTGFVYMDFHSMNNMAQNAFDKAAEREKL